MTHEERAERRLRCTGELNERLKRSDGEQVVNGLVHGLNVVRDSLFVRVHDDVEQTIGTDSMLLSSSMFKQEVETRLEIDLYQIAESDLHATARGYCGTGEPWYRKWITTLRMDQPFERSRVEQRLAGYASKSADDRRLAFTDVLERTFPEARRAPLVIYRLVPLAVWIATSLAFGDHAEAKQLRKNQVALLPPITDCQECRGELLENGEQCRNCGNPLWKYKWLMATD